MSSKVLRLDRLNIQQTKLLNEISFEVREKFNNYITQISLPHASDLDWLISTFNLGWVGREGGTLSGVGIGLGATRDCI